MSETIGKNEEKIKKGDYVINPKTNRLMKVGGRTWLKAVSEGIIEYNIIDENELKEMPPDATPEQWEGEKAKLNSALPMGKQAVKGRGKHKGKIVLREKGINPLDASIYAGKLATRAVSKNIDTLANADEDEIDAMLEKMILAEMIEEKEARGNIKTYIAKAKGNGYEVQSEEDDEEYEDNYYDPNDIYISDDEY